MTESLRSKLSPVCRRQLVQTALVWISCGLLTGACLGLGLAGIRYFGGWTAGSLFAIAALVAGPLAACLAVLAILVPRPNWIAAARAVDHHYDLKDRTESALDFSHRAVAPDKRTFATLQIEDALSHLDHIAAEAVVPLKPPRLLSGAVVATVAALVLALLPLTPVPLAAAPSEPEPQIVAQADEISESLKELEEELKEDVDPELDQLLKELKEKAEELKEPGVDVKEALAKISEMQAAIQSAQSQSSLEQIDQNLQEIGEAMASAKALEGAGQALAEGKYEKATKELANLEDLEFDRNEARNTAEKLRKAARKSGDAGNGDLSDATNQIAEGIEGDDAEATRGGARKLGDKVAKQARRKKINDLLNAELTSLAECKCQCQKNGTVKGLKKQKSNSPSTTFGMTESGNTDGDSTSLEASVNREQINGQAGEGESEFETSSTSEGRQEAQRGYKEVYQKYKKISEAVLDSEQIPLGHRQTIRKYFESIRPQQSEGEAESK